jgi:cytochrome P450
LSALADDVARFFVDESARVDPYPLFNRLLSEEPVHRTMYNTCVVSKHRDVVDLLAKSAVSVEFWSRMEGDAPANPDDLRRQMLPVRDTPAHARMRGIVNRFFSEPSAHAWRGTIERIVENMLSAVEGRPLDVIADLAVDLPVFVNCAVLGVPREHWTAVAAWAAEFTRFVAPQGAITPLIADFAAYAEELAACAPGSPIVDALSDARRDGSLAPSEFVSMVMLLLASGRETATNMIGNSVFTLLRYRDQAARLKQHPELLGASLEECLRFESPVFASARVAAQDFAIGGTTIHEGEVVLALLAAANRDPARFHEPERFAIDRDPNPHLAFGAGPHLCLGRSFARLEGKVVLDCLFRKSAGIDLATSESELVWSGVFPFRGLVSLPVAVAR